MMKSLVAANRSEKDSFRIPHSVQQSIPIQRIYADGIWQVGRKHSKTWRFTDINYAASSQEAQHLSFLWRGSQQPADRRDGQNHDHQPQAESRGFSAHHAYAGVR